MTDGGRTGRRRVSKPGASNIQISPPSLFGNPSHVCVLRGATQLSRRGEGGQHFKHGTNVGLVFGFNPTDASQGCEGWRICVGPSESQPYFADLAARPQHGLTTLDICASDFRNSDNSGLMGSNSLWGVEERLSGTSKLFSLIQAVLDRCRLPLTNRPFATGI
jgi:hypothetical protein